jgi:hypothetical protein
MTCNENLLGKLSNNTDEDLFINNEKSQVFLYINNKHSHQPFQYL